MMQKIIDEGIAKSPLKEFLIGHYTYDFETDAYYIKLRLWGESKFSVSSVMMQEMPEGLVFMMKRELKRLEDKIFEFYTEKYKEQSSNCLTYEGIKFVVDNRIPEGMGIVNPKTLYSLIERIKYY